MSLAIEVALDEVFSVETAFLVKGLCNSSAAL
jgi:hypothetical protein